MSTSLTPALAALLTLLLLLSLLLATEAYSRHPYRLSRHTCSYQLPKEEEVVLNVPLIDTTTARRKRNTLSQLLNTPFQPLRIFLYFDPSSINALPSSKQLFINSSLLPQAISFWEQSLHVRPSNAPIRLSRKCKSNHYYFDPSDAHPSCVERCKAVASCGEVAIPDQHLYQCRYCALPNPLTCTTSGPPDGEGVSGADFLLYVSAVNSSRCENEDTIAYAAHCQQEGEMDRPIAGHVNICPNALSTHAHDEEILLSTVKHEILHALGFSAGLYAFFRHTNGQPRTKRNRFGRPLVFNRERGYYEPDNSTIQQVVREDWWTEAGPVAHPVHMLVTERVKEEARKHFGCHKLEGAELENQGGDGTALTHWEKRLFENEAMTGTHTQNPSYSRLTFALLEDSGWYKSDYSAAEQLHWGHSLGCQFAQHSCGHWIRSRLEKNKSASPFCYSPKHDGSKSLATTRCTDQRDSLALCNLIPYKHPLPVDYRNFAHLKGVRKEGLKYYGGSVELADYCPYNQEFEWKALAPTDTRRDSRCELRSNAPPSEESNSVMEVYGESSRCFDLEGSWTERRCGRVKTYSQFGAGCYGFFCAEGRLHVEVENVTAPFVCYYTGQRLRIRRLIGGGWLRDGSIRCPPCEDICTKKEQWRTSLTTMNGSSAGVIQHCLPDDRRLGEEVVGDEEMEDEPCGGRRRGDRPPSILVAFLIALPLLFSHAPRSGR